MDRLKSRKVISHLFSGKGASFARHPVRLVWVVMPLEVPCPTQVAYSVSKRNFKKAVDRNLLRRRLKEAWRLNKSIVNDALQEKGLQAAIMVIYQGKEEADFHTIQQKMVDAMRLFVKNVQPGNFSDEKNVS